MAKKNQMYKKCLMYTKHDLRVEVQKTIDYIDKTCYPERERFIAHRSYMYGCLIAYVKKMHIKYKRRRISELFNQTDQSFKDI
jgi:hypothetical protein